MGYAIRIRGRNAAASLKRIERLAHVSGGSGIRGRNAAASLKLEPVPEPVPVPEVSAAEMPRPH